MHAYRLTVAAPAPDYELFVTPANPTCRAAAACP